MNAIQSGAFYFLLFAIPFLGGWIARGIVDRTRKELDK
jgi:hypothetical protein